VNAWPIHLDMHPGDTMGQARALYRTIDPAALLGLVENGWSVAPNFHIAFMSSNLYWGQTDLPLEEYVEYWKNQVATEGLAQVPREQWEGYFGTLLSQRIISGRDVDGINELVTPTAMSTLNICPGISIRYSWAREDAIKLDDGDLFLNEFLKRVNDVLNVW